MKRLFWLLISVLSLLSSIGNAQIEYGKGSPIDPMPRHIRQLTTFGERADWSHDGKHIAFLEKSFGDVFEVEVATGKLRPLTHHFFHHGFLRVLYLANGDYLLVGARQFDPKNPWKSRSPEQAELWVLKKDLSGPPTPLGVFCKEGPTASRRTMTIAWTIDNIYTADISYDHGVPKLINQQTLLSPADLPEPVRGWHLETQNFRPPLDKELIFNAHFPNGNYVAETMGIDLATKRIVNYSKRPDRYDEPEGIFPDGNHTLVESNRHRPQYKDFKAWATIDLYKLSLDGSGEIERITFFNDNPEHKATNPVVSDDGRYMAFQYAYTTEVTGIGHGILIWDFTKAIQTRQRK